MTRAEPHWLGCRTRGAGTGEDTGEDARPTL